jgi:transposase
MDPGDADVEDQGGDPVCWLSRTCPECGAMPSPEDGDADRCWRCGRTRDAG